ncbi:MAG: DNA polymerase III subunit delta [Bacteroidales bacterium]|nr:DNA polymerase III subunit delta [Bacteroidales bacterium]
MLFSQVIGQDELKRKLINSAISGRIPHAQLFFGPEGSGSLPLAIAYAQYVFCTDRTDTDSCGRCPHCMKIKKLSHPDLHFSFPVNTTGRVVKDPVSDNFINEWREFVISNPYFLATQWYEKIGVENKQGLINRKESEEIIKKLRFKPFESEYKFMIIWLPEKMNSYSANVLLKLIEEPPEKTVFLLVSDQPEQLLTTISSRTQPVKLARIDNESLSLELIDKFQIAKKDLSNIVRLSGGSYCRAQEIVQSAEDTNFYLDSFILIMRLVYSRSFLEINNWVEEMSITGREKLKSFLSYSIKLIRENFILNLKNPDLNYLTKNEEVFSKKFHPFINGGNVIRVYEELNKAYLDVERNAYAKIVLFDMVLQFMKLIPNKKYRGSKKQ